MAGVIRAVNFTKSSGQSQRQFWAFLHELESENGDTVYYSEARWLSKGKVLHHFYRYKNRQCFLYRKRTSNHFQDASS
jgi:hypothetical protein